MTKETNSKKYATADVFRYRGTFLRIGFVLSLAFVLLAFNLKFNGVDWIIEEGNDPPIDSFFVPPTKFPKKLPKQKFKKLKKVDNKTVLEDPPELKPLYEDPDQGIDWSKIPDEKPPVEAPVKILGFAEIMPEFPGGAVSMYKFLQKNIQYPPCARENGIEGKVYITFVVDNKGYITDIKTLRDIGCGCADEAIRVIKLMPRWKPGRQGGKNVKVQYNLPVNFKFK